MTGTAPACVFFTSGSTGRPKGVVSPHRGTIRTLVGCPTLPLDADSVSLQTAPLPWDGLSLELWAPLLNGGRCVLLSPGIQLDAEALREALQRGVNSMWLTSSLFSLFAEEDPDLLGMLKLLMIGGERVSIGHVRQVLARFPELHLVNGYGPAESTIFATTHVVTPTDVTEDSTEIPIGRPVPRTGVRLLDAEGAEVSRGEIGEIAISGDGLATGYLADEAETARRFILLDGERHYRTGDLAQADPDGLLRYRGRADRQFKINGVRIEPGEVEAVLERHPSVSSCCVVRIEHVAGRPELACAYSTVDGNPADNNELRTEAARFLLGVMVPTLLRHVEHLPLGATGKVDTAAVARLLIGPNISGRGAAPAVPSDTPSAGDINDLLHEVRLLLDSPGLRVGDDLFEAGVSSLDAVRIAMRASRRLGARITVADIYRLGSLEALHAAAPGAPASDSFLDSGTTGPMALSAAQSRFWMAEQSNPGAADNMVVLAYVLTGPLDRTILSKALQDIVDRHAALRTVYSWGDELPEQRVLPPNQATITLEQVGPGPSWPDGDDRAQILEETVQQACADWWRQPFSLEDEPSLRARLVTWDERRHLLCLQVHHIAFDGWSELVLIDDLRTAYRARLLGASPGFPPDAATYLGYSVWEQRNSSQWARGELPHWRRTLATVPASALPPPKDGSANEAARLECTVTVARETVALLSRAARGAGGPPSPPCWPLSPGRWPQHSTYQVSV
ncbi:AMP-binding protein [Kitasatospora saccharophila]|uniref:AMP-binding protein n=1 Tax=Kitasatospora saccharophila TaxID=407973 RepID=UPI0036412F12